MLDVDEASRFLLTGSADMSARVWEVETGVEVANIPHGGPVRACAFAERTRDASGCDGESRWLCERCA